MTGYRAIWRLPGPGAFVRDLVRRAEDGQHTTAVVPRHIFDDPEYVDALAAALTNEIIDSQRVYPSTAHGDLVSALAVATTGDDDAPPVIGELLRHVEVAGRIYICSGADLDPSHAAELALFLDRLDAESRPIPAGLRCTLVVIAPDDLIPPDPASVVSSRVWYWGRVTRWDVAAHLLGGATQDGGDSVLEDVRVESVMEVARWNLLLATALDQCPEEDWSTRLPVLEGVRRDAPRVRSGSRPPPSHLDDWNAGFLELWHGEVTTLPDSRNEAILARLRWAAHARVILPWLELRRARLEEIVTERFGQLPGGHARLKSDERDRHVPELTELARFIHNRAGERDDRLRTSAWRLVRARNRLAHLDPLSEADLAALIKAGRAI